MEKTEEEGSDYAVLFLSETETDKEKAVSTENCFITLVSESSL